MQPAPALTASTLPTQRLELREHRPEHGGIVHAADPVDMLEVLVRDGIPKSLPGPDGRPRPPIPLGRRVSLPGRGTTFVREVSGPPGAPTLLLLHGWVASGGLNWFRAFETLGREFHILAPDLRGHARGVRSTGAFQLTDCADDLAALLDTLAVGPVLVAGYSMGGSVAQLLARRHPELVAGLVLCRDSAPVLHQACPGAADRQPARCGRERGSASADASCTFLRHRYEP